MRAPLAWVVVDMRIHSGPVGSIEVNTDQDLPHVDPRMWGESSRTGPALRASAPPAGMAKITRFPRESQPSRPSRTRIAGPIISGREEIRHVAGKTYRIDSGADESEGVTLGVEQRVDDLRELAGGEEPSHGRPANYDYEKLPTRRALDHLDHPPEQRTRATAHGMRADRRWRCDSRSPPRPRRRNSRAGLGRVLGAGSGATRIGRHDFIAGRRERMSQTVRERQYTRCIGACRIEVYEDIPRQPIRASAMDTTQVAETALDVSLGGAEPVWQVQPDPPSHGGDQVWERGWPRHRVIRVYRHDDEARAV